MQREKVERFWRSVTDIILLRMARKVVKKISGTAADEEVERYAKAHSEQLDIEHLSEETRMRIENLGELMELKERMHVDRLRGVELR